MKEVNRSMVYYDEDVLRITLWTLLVNAASLLFRRRARSKLRVLTFFANSSNAGYASISISAV